MSYDKQTWETGEVITASKLNHMEDGIAESGSGSGGGVKYETLSIIRDVETDQPRFGIYDSATDGIIPVTYEMLSSLFEDGYTPYCEAQSFGIANFYPIFSYEGSYSVFIGECHIDLEASENNSVELYETTIQILLTSDGYDDASTIQIDRFEVAKTGQN